MKDFLHTLGFMLVIFGFIVLSEITHIHIAVLIIGAILLFMLFGWIKINFDVKKSSNEREKYKKFLKDNDCDYYYYYGDDIDIDKDKDKERIAKELELCNKFLEENPNNKEAFSRKAFLLFKSEKYQEAIKLYKIITKSDRYDDESFINYAQCYYAFGDKDKALEILKKRYSGVSEESKAEYHEALAKLYKNLKLYDKSVEEYTSAINFRPDEQYYLRDRAEIYKITKQYDKALEDYNKAIELDTEYEFFYSGRAEIYKVLKQYDKAIEDYTKAIELDTEYGFYYEYRAKVYAIIKDYDKAIADLKKSDEWLNISNDDSHYENTIFMFEYQEFLISNDFDILADDSENEENTLKELELCDKFLKESPDNKCAIKRKAELYFKLKKYNEALKIYNTLLEKDIEYTDRVAVCHYALGDKEKALKIMEDHYQGRKKDEYYYSNLAEMNEVAKEYNEAIKNYTSAINCKPDYPYYYRSRAEIYKILGEQDKYEADMKKFKKLEEEYNNDDIEDEEIDDNSSKEGLNKNLKP